MSNLDSNFPIEIEPKGYKSLLEFLKKANDGDFTKGPPETHGGRVSLVLLAFLLINNSLFDVMNGPDYIFIDIGCGIGQVVAFVTLLNEKGPKLAIGVEIDNDRIKQAKKKSRKIFKTGVMPFTSVLSFQLST